MKSIKLNSTEEYRLKQLIGFFYPQYNRIIVNTKTNELVLERYMDTFENYIGSWFEFVIIHLFNKLYNNVKENPEIYKFQKRAQLLKNVEIYSISVDPEEVASFRHPINIMWEDFNTLKNTGCINIKKIIMADME